MSEGLSRRGLLGLLGAGAGGLVVGGIGGVAIGAGVASSAAAGAAGTVHPFYGAHQGGISTPVQEHLHFAAFDMADDATRDDLISLLKDWTYASARMTKGLDVSAKGAVHGSPQAPPDDTGEALGLSASALTITFGFGPGLFTNASFGLAAARPAQLADLPPFIGEQLDAQLCGGDLCIQACADDPQVAFHAVRNLSRIAFGRARIRWSQLGFGRTSKTTADQSTPRNLFGFKDGTANILADDPKALDEHVWASASDGPAWLVGGSYLAVRNIRQRIETWDRVRLVEQEQIIGRDKGEGAPLSGGTEFTALDFHKKDAAGRPAIDVKAHARLAHPELNQGVRLLRRGYNFVNGNDLTGDLSAGLFFLSYQRSPDRFIRVQRSVAKDLMAEYLVHVGSAIFAVPPGTEEGSYVGAGLFAAT
ncbi:iron uptake transporter deferrochelatase/peroxidase subunit [Microbacterium terrisoli]|uniref:iron uptake transporter deferrochelatase/peroxidase subunit n=1 Tax=Microbacterium terrisoli TaxID=3242192 RepID=UPI0028039CAD|nr:iron uptake transporter deferrochelatase/peroxidase subunit [Microbacterium protaetiae]